MGFGLYGPLRAYKNQVVIQQNIKGKKKVILNHKLTIVSDLCIERLYCFKVALSARVQEFIV